MTNNEALDKTGYIDSVKILDVEKRYKPGPKHYVYIIQVTWANPTNIFIIYRRYAQFFDLQCKLLDLFAETPQSTGKTQSRQIPFLPGKIILGRSQVRQIALERKDGLNEYCQALISLPEHISRSRPILEFFHPTVTDVPKPVESIVKQKTSIGLNSLVISAPTKMATYRCLADFKATDKTEMSLKRNDIVQVRQKHANGWWFVQFGDQTGFVPGAYLEPSELKRGAREGKTFEKSLNEMYIVNKSYEGTNQDELSLEQGSFVTVVEKSFTGWWTVKFNDITGQFPAIYLSSCEGQHTPEIIRRDTSNITFERQNSHDSDDSNWDDDEEYHTASSNDSKPELYYAHSTFLDNVGDCLSFERGDIIEIHDKHPSGWWFGRRMKGGHVLTWIPANYLQKEPISNDHTENFSSNKQHEKEKSPSENIYENLGNQNSTDDIYAKVLKVEQPIGKTILEKKAPFVPPVLPVKNDQEKPSIINPQQSANNNHVSGSKSVKDLVKKFNPK